MKKNIFISTNCAVEIHTGNNMIKIILAIPSPLKKQYNPCSKPYSELGGIPKVNTIFTVF